MKWNWNENLEPSPATQVSARSYLSDAPIILVAVDLAQEWRDLAIALRNAAERIYRAAPHARLACVTVLKTQRIGIDIPTDADGKNWHIKLLVALKQWAHECQISREQMTFHVLATPDPAEAILEYAHSNQVDHIVLGARGSGAMRRHLRSVSARVVAQANCTVTVVKLSS